MSQSGLLDSRRDEEWDHWYVEHCRLMATVPGISSAQRFRTDAPDASPSLAMYSIASPDVFEDAYYLSVRGFGEWKPYIDRRHYHRNLFAGAEQTPHVHHNEWLLVADRDSPTDAELAVELVWLESVGLDRSTPYRALGVITGTEAPSTFPATAVYRPVTARFGGSS